MLRQHGVVGKFVEFFGPGLSKLPLADRATLANMAPEYGATIGFFPVDAETLTYLRMTRAATSSTSSLSNNIAASRACSVTDDAPDPVYSDLLELDMGDVEPSLAGPRRPQDRVAAQQYEASVSRDHAEGVRPRSGSAKEASLAPVAVKAASQSLTASRRSRTAQLPSPPLRAARTRPILRSWSERACWRKRPSSWTACQAVGQDQLGARFQSRYRLS